MCLLDMMSSVLQIPSEILKGNTRHRLGAILQLHNHLCPLLLSRQEATETPAFLHVSCFNLLPVFRKLISINSNKQLDNLLHDNLTEWGGSGGKDKRACVFLRNEK